MANDKKGDDTAKTILLILLAIILPPVAVWCIDGCGLQLLLNVSLACLAYFPAIIHAMWLVLSKRG